MRFIKSKSLKLLISLMMIIPMFTVPISATSSDKLFELSTIETTQQGEEVELKVHVNPRLNLSSFDFEILYDKEAFEIIGGNADYKLENTFPQNMFFANVNESGRIRLGYVSAYSIPEVTNNVLTIFKFKVLDSDKAVGEKDFKFSNINAANQSNQVLDSSNEYVDTSTFINVPIQTIAINEQNIIVSKGNTQQLTVAKTPTYTTETSSIKWSTANSEVAAVDSKGVVTAKGVGTTTITATVAGKTATTTVTVNAPLTSIEITGDATMNIDDSKTLAVKYNPEDTTSDKTVKWSSSNLEVATINENGVVTAIDKGTTTITAKVGNITDTLEITVKKPIKEITINSDNFELIKAKTKDLVSGFNPEDTTDTVKSINWESSDDTIVSLKADGNKATVTGLEEGTATITVTYTINDGATGKDRNVSKSIIVEVKENHVTSLKITESLSLNKGKTGQIDLTYGPSDTTDDVTKIIYSSSNEDVATVDNNGKVTAVSGGSAIITAHLGSVVSNECIVSVNVPLESIEVTQVNELFVKDTKKLDVTYKPTDTTVTKDVTWTSSDKTIATVDKDGKVTAVKKGIVTITAKVAGKEASTTIDVKQHVEKLVINEGDFTLLKGKDKTLTVSENPSTHDDGKAIETTWTSSNPNVATVNKDGKVIALKEGTTNITVTYTYSNGHKATGTVVCTGQEKKITKVTLNKETLDLAKGTNEKLSATYDPADTTDDTTITWKSSNEAVASVDKDGKVTAQLGGTAKITATIAGVKSNECTVNVNVPLTSIDLSGENTVLKNQTISLSIVKTPADATDILTDIKYSVSDSNIASVDNNGTVAGLKEGSVTVTVTAKVGSRNFTATKDITVTEKKLTSINLKADSNRMLINTAMDTTVTFNPTDTTDDKGLLWESSNTDVASVDENGKITALKPGTVTITATSKANNNIKDSLEIEVYNIPMTGIALDMEELVMDIKDTAKLNVTILPVDTTDSKVIKWESLNPDIVEVDQEGNIKALALGVATITVTSFDGKFTDDVLIIVKEADVFDVSNANKEFNISVTDENLKQLKNELLIDYEEAIKYGAQTKIKVLASILDDEEKLLELSKLLTDMKLTDQYKLGTWLNVDILAILIPLEGEEINVKLTDLSKPLVFNVAIPESLQKDGRTFYVYRYHNGKLELVDSKLLDKATLQISSSSFSEFAIMYQDKVETETGGNTPVDTSSKPKDKTVKTGDETNITYELFAAATTLLGIILLSNKKRKYQ